MRLNTSLSWDEMFRRLLQAWRDRARVVGPEADSHERACADCASDALLALVIKNDRSLDWWPHWLAHELRSAVMQVTFIVCKQIDEQPLLDLTVSDYLIGYSSIPRATAPAVALEARDRVGFHHAVFTYWLQTRLLNLGEYPAEVFAYALGNSEGRSDGRQDA